MNTLAFALVLFGCSDDATLCERLADKARNFETRARCEMAIEQAFESELVLRADYPAVIARCMARSEAARIGKRPVDLSRPVVRLASRD